MMSELERLERASGSNYQHSARDYDLVREKVIAQPANLTEMDLAVLGYYGSAAQVAEARAARDKAKAAAPGPAALAPGEARNPLRHARIKDVFIIVGVLIDAVNKQFAIRDGEIAELKKQASFAEGERQLTKGVAWERHENHEARIAVLERAATVGTRELGAGKPHVLYRGSWVPGERYIRGDGVDHAGKVYACVEDHVARNDVVKTLDDSAVWKRVV